MKHFYISVVVFIAIVAGTLFSYNFTTSHLDRLDAQLERYTEIQSISATDLNTINKVKEEFFNKKNMLQLFIDKEHIHNVEINILLIENAVKNDDADICREKSIETIAVLEQMKEYSIAID